MKLLNKLNKIVGGFAILIATIICGGLIFHNQVIARAPEFKEDFSSYLTKSGSYVINNSNISSENSLRKNIEALFYPGGDGEDENMIFKVIRDLTLGIMIVYIVWAGATLLFNRKSEDLQKTLWSIIYVLIGGCFIYGSSWIFGNVLNFRGDVFGLGGTGIGGAAEALATGKNSLLFRVLSALKAFAFFLAIVMTVLTGIRVVAAGEGEKGKKLVRGVINVVVALLVIKGIDFIYYMAMDAGSFTKNATDFIIKVAKIFGYIYGVVIVVMILIAGYLYLTDGGGGNGFKKASNILVNVLLSALVLFAFLLILYQIFAEFQTGGDAVSMIIKHVV